MGTCVHDSQGLFPCLEVAFQMQQLITPIRLTSEIPRIIYCVYLCFVSVQLLVPRFLYSPSLFLRNNIVETRHRIYGLVIFRPCIYIRVQHQTDLSVTKVLRFS